MNENELETQVKRTQWFASFEYFQKLIHANAVNKGFWAPHLQDFLAKTMLVVTELSEAAEAWRVGDPKSQKIPTHSHCEEEIADAVIRLMDMAEFFKLDIAGAIVRKVKHNESRPHLHGRIA